MVGRSSSGRALCNMMKTERMCSGRLVNCRESRSRIADTGWIGTERRLGLALGSVERGGKPNLRCSRVKHWFSGGMEWLRVAAVICLAAFPQASNATAVHSYRPGEYDLIDHGLSPNKEYAIMAHGDSEGNPENLRLFLFDARNHRRIGPLEEVNDAGLDTGADAFRARWSADSRHVALSYRIERHINALVIYRIEGHRAHLVTGPKLVAVVAPGLPPDILKNNAVSHYTELEWLSPNRFRLTEEGFLRPVSEEAAKAFGQFGVPESGEPADPSAGRGLSFSIEAVCTLTDQDRYSITTIEPGPRPAENAE
jgi:hypothetical protein